MPRILLISGSFPPLKDGVGDYSCLLSRWLADEDPGWEVHVLTSRGCWGSSSGRARIHPVIRGWGWLGLPDIIRWVGAIAPDIVHVQYPALGYARHLMPTFLPAILRLRGRYRVTATFHGFGLYTFLGKTRLSITALGCHAVVPVSDHIRSAACSFYRGFRIFNGNIRRMKDAIYVASSIEPPARAATVGKSEVRRSWGIKPGELAIAYFGFINQGKGFDDLLRAVAMCRDQGLACRLICITELEPERDGLHRRIGSLIDELRLADLTFFTGYLERKMVAGHLMAADFAALPFNYGASTKRSSLLASLACGLPVITTSDPGLPPFFADGHNIILVPRGNPEALAAAILRLAEDRALRLRLGQGAAELSRRFNWRDIARRHRELYAGLLGFGPAGDGEGRGERCHAA